MRKVLIIEDDAEINHLLQVILHKKNCQATAAYSGTEGLLQLQQQSFDLILLDLMLPGMTGEDVLQKIRATSSVPIIVLSAKKAIEDKVHLLKNGADDYITKPFSEDEVAVRIDVQLRRMIHSNEQGKSWREIRVDSSRHAAAICGKELQLTNAEFDILCLFLDYPERALAKREIYEKIWRGTYVGDDNTISVHVSNLRKKIAKETTEEYIKTIWGIGFMLV